MWEPPCVEVANDEARWSFLVFMVRFKILDSSFVLDHGEVLEIMGWVIGWFGG